MSLGLELFPPDTPPEVRRRRLTFLAIWIAVAAMVTWPVYSWFSGIEPRILGLPLGFAWVILAALVIFLALIWLYRHEEGDPADGGSGSEGGA
ncbi:MAG: hypothetical protein MI919_26405 [Holophagales bacterium]|nr:hypothetical protein [Holophagales bacterium]